MFLLNHGCPFLLYYLALLVLLMYLLTFEAFASPTVNRKPDDNVTTNLTSRGLIKDRTTAIHSPSGTEPQRRQRRTQPGGYQLHGGSNSEGT
jgi:hypothetical protein